jgi:tetratricopeptide (TPR) repeat protein
LLQYLRAAAEISLTKQITGADEDASLSSIDELIATDPQSAVGKLRELLAGDPLNADAYRLLARTLDRAEKDTTSSAVRTFVRQFDSQLQRAGNALDADDLETAEIILRRRLLEQPAHPHALHLMANLAAALDFDDEAEHLLGLALEFDPNFMPARFDLAAALHKRNRSLEACEVLEPILAIDPNNRAAKTLKVAALGRAGKLDEALELYEELLESNPGDPKLWSSYGHYLKTAGQSEAGTNAIRRAVEVAPGDGEAWWTLANLKTVKLTERDVETMLAALASSTSATNRAHLHFALGKAFEDLGDAEEAFGHYVKANDLCRRSMGHDPDEATEEVTGARSFFTKAFFEERTSAGSPATDPIFIVGMTRSGSTLVEQILASHSQIEGTMELPYIGLIARQLGRRKPGYHDRLSALTGEQLRALGDDYLRLATSHRREVKPFFIDKMPNNWLHVPLIQLILPNARIIDVRRHPLACGMSNFRQHFARGQQFTYDLAWFGRFYSDYVRLMAHIDATLPGRVHRVFYERLVTDTETEVRKLLDYIGVPFEDSCLRFYESGRAVFTPSSEQVRRPIEAGKMDDWRAFEPWLGRLKDALGPVLGAYPDVPTFTKE